MKTEESRHPHELISVHVDGAASEQEEARLQEHLRGCPECRQMLHDLGRIHTAIGEEPVPGPPAVLRERILQKVKAGSLPRGGVVRTPFWRSPFPFAAAATLLLAATLWLALRREPIAPLPPGSGAPAPSAAQSAAPSAVLSSPASRQEPRPSAPAAGEKAKTLERLKGLGYAGSPPSPPPAAADLAERQRNAPAPEEKQEAARKESELLDKVIASGLTREPSRKSPGSEAGTTKDAEARSIPGGAGVAASADESEGARSLAYDGPDFSATFGEDGLITLVARGYACSVTVAMPAGSPRAAAGAGGSIQDLPGLFSAAASREFLAAASQARGDSGVVVGEGSSLVLRDPGGDPIHAVQFREPWAEAPPVIQQIRRGLQSLLQERYRKDLESRCGPFPEKLFASP